jgi:hypothetical protein
MTKSKVYTHMNLLQDLTEITAVLDVESQLIRALVKMAADKRTKGFELLF